VDLQKQIETFIQEQRERVQQLKNNWSFPADLYINGMESVLEELEGLLAEVKAADGRPGQ